MIVNHDLIKHIRSELGIHADKMPSNTSMGQARRILVARRNQLLQLHDEQDEPVRVVTFWIAMVCAYSKHSDAVVWITDVAKRDTKADRRRLMRQLNWRPRFMYPGLIDRHLKALTLSQPA